MKNAGLGFAVPYFIIRLKSERLWHLIFETKGYDELEEVMKAAAERWVNAVNAEGSFGHRSYKVANKPAEVSAKIDEAMAEACQVTAR